MQADELQNVVAQVIQVLQRDGWPVMCYESLKLVQPFNEYICMYKFT